MHRSDLRILIVDDDEVFVALLRGGLRSIDQFRAVVTVVGDADEAIQALRTGTFDVCLLDYRLRGGGSGLDVLREARVLELPSAVVFMTGFDDVELERQAIELGADEYLSKDLPPTARMLERAVRSALHRRRLESEARAASRAATASERRLRYILDWTTHLIYEWSIENDELLFTSDVTRVLGLKPDEAPLTRAGWQRLLHPEDLANVGDAVERHLSGERAEFFEEYRIRGADGSYRVWSDRGRLARGDGGERIRWIGIVTDVTEQRQHAEQDQARQRLEAIGRLAGGVAHDFNNLITVMVGYLALATEQVPPESPLASDLQNVLSAAERAAGLTRQLLAFSRRQVLAPVIFDINDAVQSISGLIERTIGEHVRITHQLADNLSLVRADPGQIEQALLNLVINARDAMPSGGGLEIATAAVAPDDRIFERRAAMPPASYVCLSVADTGVGIPPEVIDHIFEPFFTTKERGRGTGLGLSMVYGIVKQSGGFIWVDSAPGQGTRFSIYLPVVDGTRTVVAPPPPHDRPPARRTQRILVVEDDDIIRSLTEAVLRRVGYDVLTAADGAQALRIAEAQDGIDLVLTDLVLTDMHGVDVAARLQESLRAVPTVFMSGYTEQEFGTRLPEGFRLLNKPFTPGALVRFVEESMA